MELNIKLTRNEAGQLIDTLESRCEAYRKTAEYFRGENDGGYFLIEDVTDEQEAESLYEMYRAIIEKIRGQLT